ncbi:hypothetical protein [Jatrophihabitans sp.]|jgi:hypothetical protein|uniref:hypothetical protein n=1 Tax=Jatrophihabitans sp. TaxID=1932789 RepID=UPI002F183F30
MSNENGNEFGTAFVRTYSQVMTDVWTNEEEERRVVADPTGYAIEKGLPVAPGSTVRLDRSQPATLFTRDEIVEAWTKTPGMHVLHIPATPLVDVNELTEAELDAVGAGTNNIIFIVIL